MDDFLPPPVRGVTKAFRRGTSLVQRICKIAKTESAAHQLDVLPPTESLLWSLERSEGLVREGYTAAERSVGRAFGEGIINDRECIFTAAFARRRDKALYMLFWLKKVVYTDLDLQRYSRIDCKP